MFKVFFKKALKKTWGFILGFLVFELVMLITTSKIYSINKNIIAPFYSDSEYSIKNLVMLVISIVMFVWLIKRKYVRNRKYIFGISFGLTASVIFFTQSPFYQFYNKIGNDASSLISSDNYYKNLVVSSAKRYFGTDYKDVIKFYSKINLKDLKTSELPWIAMAHESSLKTEDQENAKILWNELYERLEPNDRQERDRLYQEFYIKAFTAYSQKFFYTKFKSRDLKKIVENALYEANRFRYGVGRDINTDEYYKIINTLEDYGFEFVIDIKKFNEPKKVNLNDLMFY